MYKATAQTQVQPEPTWYLLKDMLIKSIFKDLPQQTTVSRKEKKGLVLANALTLTQPKYNISSYLKFGGYNEIILEFYNKLEDNFSECDLTAFYKNFKELTITSKKRTLSEYIE